MADTSGRFALKSALAACIASIVSEPEFGCMTMILVDTPPYSGRYVQLFSDAGATLTADVCGKTFDELGLKVDKSGSFHMEGGCSLPSCGCTAARHIARQSGKLSLLGDAASRPAVDSWVSLAQMLVLDGTAGYGAVEQALVHDGAGGKYLVNDTLSLADIVMFAALDELFTGTDGSAFAAKHPNLAKRYEILKGLQEFASGAKGKKGQAPPIVGGGGTKKAPKSESKGIASGSTREQAKFVSLPGAEHGKVVVRFPPEASGYLHIGHAKAALLNAHYQKSFAGKLIMRFDDTNPAKESSEFEQEILADLESLHIKPDIWSHSSDHFDTMLELCEKLLKEGKAYVDATDAETMKKERETRTESKYRHNDPDTNLKMWSEMVRGTPQGQKCAVRMKIDMNSNNGCMRDPTIYRCKPEVHVRTGDKYKVYPTYDFCCPIVDSLEGVTHALRTTEYHDRDEQYAFILDALNMRKPTIYDYARLNMTHTVMSKRKLTWFVQNGLVSGWDDPRLPTSRGVLRRGLTVEGLKEFVLAQGGSRSVVMMTWDKIWAFNKKVIDPVAPRYTALDKSTLVPVTVEGAKDETKYVPLHPKTASIGEKQLRYGGRVLVESSDAQLFKSGDTVTFMNWGNAVVKSVEGDADGGIAKVVVKMDLQNTNYSKTLKVTWLADSDLFPITCVHYDHLITKDVIPKDDDWQKYINYESEHRFALLGEPGMVHLHKGDIIQLQRKGFYICDQPYVQKSEFTGNELPMVLIHVPDGKEKELPTAMKKPASSKSIVAADSKTLVVDGPAKTGDKGAELLLKIKDIGEKIRDMKQKKATKAELDPFIKELVSTKGEYKNQTGKDWAPDLVEKLASQAQLPAPSDSDNSAHAILVKIKEIGDKIRELKQRKADKHEVDARVQQLQAEKAKYKELAGKPYDPREHDSIRQALTEASTAAIAVVMPHSTDQPDSAPGKIVPTPCAMGHAHPVGLSEADCCLLTVKQLGDKIRDLKAAKADKAQVDAQVKLMLAEKDRYKQLTGADWNPSLVEQVVHPANEPKGEQPISRAVASDTTADATSIAFQPIPPPVHSHAVGLSESDACLLTIKQIGEDVRRMKTEKAEKSAIDAKVKELLAEKTHFKQLTGSEWNPKLVDSVVHPANKPIGGQSGNGIGDTITKAHVTPNTMAALAPGETVPQLTPPQHAQKVGLSEADSCLLTVKQLGDKIRDLKAAKADKAQVEAQGMGVPQVKLMLAEKDRYKQLTGVYWNPSLVAQVVHPANEPLKGKPDSGGDIKKAHVTPTTSDTMGGGDDGGLKAKVDAQADRVRQLKQSKADKAEIDAAVAQLLKLKQQYKDATGVDLAGGGGDKKAKENKGGAKGQNKAAAAAAAAEKALQDKQKQTKLGLEVKKFDTEIKKLGVVNAYFPMFVSQAALEREKAHIADFAPEVAWVTKCGNSEMSEPVAIRPTSETVMYPSYAKWIQSHRDLPLKINQWCNVVRWEFKHPTPFLRTREFLWQEGHSAFAEADEAKQEVYTILDLYARIYTDLLAVPVIKGHKTEREKFAGGDFTTTVEAYIPATGRGIQGATSHHLGQNFSKMFDITFEDPQTQNKSFVHQNSWGITTRTIGVFTMVHGDDRGLVLPPRVAQLQAVVIPCGVTANMSPADENALYGMCTEYVKRLREAGVRAHTDLRDNYSPGWKFNHWELKGVPLRIELGPRDIAKKEFVAVRRDTGEKITGADHDLPNFVSKMLETIHDAMFKKAKTIMDAHVTTTEKWDTFQEQLDKKCLVISPFCGVGDCEETIKKESAREDMSGEGGAMGAKSLCIPFDQPKQLKADQKCVHPSCGKMAKFYCMFGRSY